MRHSRRFAEPCRTAAYRGNYTGRGHPRILPLATNEGLCEPGWRWPEYA